MLILGVDVGYRNFGYCLVRVNGTPEVEEHGTIDLGNTTAWRSLITNALDELWDFNANIVAIEELVWYGKRKGVLALAHLAGAVAGYAYGTMKAKPLFFVPKLVKEMSRTYPAPEGFTKHEHDALSLCRLALGEQGSRGNKADGKNKLVKQKKSTRSTTS